MEVSIQEEALAQELVAAWVPLSFSRACGAGTFSRTAACCNIHVQYGKDPGARLFPRYSECVRRRLSRGVGLV